MRSANRADSCSVSDWVDDFISMVAFRSLRRQAPAVSYTHLTLPTIYSV